jgi:hypothetical protein
MWRSDDGLDFLDAGGIFFAPMPTIGFGRMAVLASLALWLSSCGTVCNLLSEKPQPYGGVVRDAAIIASVPAGSGPTSGMNGDGRAFLVLLGLGACELCATGLADTMMLPWFYYRDGDLKGAEPPPSKEDADLPEGFWEMRPQFSAGAIAHETVAPNKVMAPDWRLAPPPEPEPKVSGTQPADESWEGFPLGRVHFGN